jgi:hypothetical protein
MRKLAAATRIVASAVVAVALALPVSLAMAAAAAMPGDYAGKTESEITTALEQQGYEVRKVETEDGFLEAYTLFDGARFEIFVDPKTGTILKSEYED